jgi:hypothetical protein
MLGVRGGLFVAGDLTFMGVSFAVTSSGFVLADDVFVLGFAFAVVFAFGFAVVFFAVGFFVIFAMIGLLVFFSGTTVRFSSFFLFVFLR